MKIEVRCYRATCGKSFEVDIPPRSCPACGFRDLGVEEGSGLHKLCKAFVSRHGWDPTDSEKGLLQWLAQHPEVLEEWQEARKVVLDPTVVELPDGANQRQAMRAFLALPNTWAPAHTQDELFLVFPVLRKLTQAFLDFHFPKPKPKKAKKQPEPKPLELDLYCRCGWTRKKALEAPQYCPRCSRRSEMSIEQENEWRAVLMAFAANRGWSRHESRLIRWLFLNPGRVEEWRDVKCKLTNPKLFPPDLSRGPAVARQNFVRLVTPTWRDSHDDHAARFFSCQPLLRQLLTNYLKFWTDYFEREAA